MASSSLLPLSYCSLASNFLPQFSFELKLTENVWGHRISVSTVPLLRRKPPVTPWQRTLGNMCSPCRCLTPQDQTSSPEFHPPVPMSSLICPSFLGSPLSFLPNKSSCPAQTKVDLDGSKLYVLICLGFLRRESM